MIKNASLAWALAATALALPQTAMAASQTSFDFYEFSLSNLLDKTFATYQTSAGGVGLSIQAVSSDPNAKVAVRWDGIGMSKGLLDAGELNSGLLGGTGDALLLSFDQAVSLGSLDVSGWDNGLLGLAIDKVSITTGGQTFQLGNNLNNGQLPVTTFSLGAIPSGRFFLISAEGSLSSFRLAGLNVSAVPELSTPVMLGIGLLALGLLQMAPKQTAQRAQRRGAGARISGKRPDNH